MNRDFKSSRLFLCLVKRPFMVVVMTAGFVIDAVVLFPFFVICLADGLFKTRARKRRR
jgi:hypothetical protein